MKQGVKRVQSITQLLDSKITHDLNQPCVSWHHGDQPPKILVSFSRDSNRPHKTKQNKTKQNKNKNQTKQKKLVLPSATNPSQKFKFNYGLESN